MRINIKGQLGSEEAGERQVSQVEYSLHLCWASVFVYQGTSHLGFNQIGEEIGDEQNSNTDLEWRGVEKHLCTCSAAPEHATQGVILRPELGTAHETIDALYEVGSALELPAF